MLVESYHHTDDADLNLLKSFYILLGPPQPLETLGSEDVTGDKKGANRGQKGSEPGTKRERTGDVAKMCLLFDQGGDSNYLWTNWTFLKNISITKVHAVIHILGFRCFFFFAYKYLYTCLAGTPAQPYCHKG